MFRFSHISNFLSKMFFHEKTLVATDRLHYESEPVLNIGIHYTTRLGWKGKIIFYRKINMFSYVPIKYHFQIKKTRKHDDCLFIYFFFFLVLFYFIRNL